MQPQNSISNKLLVTKTNQISYRIKPETISAATLVGLILIGLGIFVNSWRLSQFSAWIGIPLNLTSMEGGVRIWLLRGLLICTGTPLLLYQFRRQSWGYLFDIAMGVTLAVVSIIFIDGFFFLLNISKMKETPPTSLAYSEVYLESNEVLGYKLKAGMKVAAKQKVADKVIYDVTYSTNTYGRRVTPPLASLKSKDQFILFFGGSFTFGDGVNDDETLPASVSRLTSNYKIYNYGVSGYGTQQLLLTLQQDNLDQEIKEKEGLVIYTFICPHIRRVIGASEVHNSWGSVMPLFTLDANDNLIRKQDFVSGRPGVSALYNLVGSSEVAKYFNVVLPLQTTDEHIRLTAELIEAAQDTFRERFGGDNNLYVLFYPQGQRCEQQLIPHLEKRGINYLDYSDLFIPRNKGELSIPDGHPTAKAYQIVAKELVKDLGLTDAK